MQDLDPNLYTKIPNLELVVNSKMVAEPISDIMECKSYYTYIILCIEVKYLDEGNHIGETLLHFCKLFGLSV